MVFKIFIPAFLLSLYSFADIGIPTEISTFSNKKPVFLSAIIEMPTHSFLISTNAGRVNQAQVDQRIQYNPTFGPNVGVRGTYEQWDLSLSKKLNFSNAVDEKKYGKTSYDDLRLGFKFSDVLAIESYYQSYRGFYTDLSGQQGLQSTFDGSGGSAASGPSQIINRSDISALNFGFRLSHTLPLMPLFRAFEISQAEKAKMNWDFNLLSKIYYNRLRISGDQALVPATTTNSFSPIALLKEYSANTIGLGLGLGAAVPMSVESTFGFEALLGVGLQRQANDFSDHNSISYTTAQEMNAKLFIDWAGQQHGLRTNLYLDTYSAKVDDINFDTSNLGVNLIYSYTGFSL